MLNEVPTYSDPIVSSEAPVARFAAKNAAILGLSPAFVKHLMRISVACGYEDVLDAAAYPMPPGNIKLPGSFVSMLQTPARRKKCEIFGMFAQAAMAQNECFNPCTAHFYFEVRQWSH